MRKLPSTRGVSRGGHQARRRTDDDTTSTTIQRQYGAEKWKAVETEDDTYTEEWHRAVEELARTEPRSEPDQEYLGTKLHSREQIFKRFFVEIFSYGGVGGK